MSGSDHPTSDELRSRRGHAVRAVRHLGAVTATVFAGMWLLDHFGYSPLVAALSGILYWEVLVRAQFHAYLTHASGVLSPALARKMEENR